MATYVLQRAEVLSGEEIKLKWRLNRKFMGAILIGALLAVPFVARWQIEEWKPRSLGTHYTVMPFENLPQVEGWTYTTLSEGLTLATSASGSVVVTHVRGGFHEAENLRDAFYGGGYESGGTSYRSGFFEAHGFSGRVDDARFEIQTDGRVVNVFEGLNSAVESFTRSLGDVQLATRFGR